MFRKKTLDDLYPEFHRDLLAGRIDIVRDKLKKYPALARYDQKDSLPPVISAIHHSSMQQNAPQILDLLKEYKANFNVEYYVSNYFRLSVNCALNPLAYLLLNGGDSRLIQKLIECGTEKNHPSVSKISKLVNDHKNDRAIDYPAHDERNPNDCPPTKLVLNLR